MTSIKHSYYYMWKTSNVLGAGSTGIIYQGLHQFTGESVAVKTYHNPSHPLNDPQMQEFEALKKLSHDNVVKFHAVEEEDETHTKVLVMELCNGGSLSSILDDPQNCYGLNEVEFLRVLHDISDGLKYLWDKGVFDHYLKAGNVLKFIKVETGNIMKCVNEDGSSVYKLKDFMGCWKPEEDRQFVPLNATEEYLNPDLYEQFVLNEHSEKTFDATAAVLWSVGVTLYHAATGSLPFRPYGGRNDIKVMHSIITQKESGVISGIQYSNNGPIEWSRELPKACLLNQGLSDLVAKLLAGSLENNKNKMWNFEDFFANVNDILSHKAVHVFYMNEGKEFTLYMQPYQILEDMKEQIAAQLAVPAESQMLLYDEAIFDNIDPSAKVSTFPQTSPTRPLVLLHSENNVVKGLTRFGSLSACFPKLDTLSVNVQLDAALAKSYCSVTHAIKRLVEKLMRCREVLLSTVKLLLYLIRENVIELCTSLDILNQQVEELNDRFNTFEKSALVPVKFLTCWPLEHNHDNEEWELLQLVSEKKQLKNEISTDFQSLQIIVSNLKHSALDSKLLQKEWDQAISHFQEPSGCVQKANTYVNEMRGSWRVLMQTKYIIDHTGRNLSDRGQRSHMLEKLKMQQVSEKLVTLVEECVEACQQAFCNTNDVFSDIQAIMGQCKSVEKIMVSVSSKVKNCTASFPEAESNSDEIQKSIIAQLKANRSTYQSFKMEVPSFSISSSHSTHSSSSHNRTRRSSASKAELKKQLKALKDSHLSLKEQISESDSLTARLHQVNQQLEESLVQGNCL